MANDGSTIEKTLRRFRSFRYSLIMEGVLAGALAGFAVVLFRLLLEGADRLPASVPARLVEFFFLCL